MSVTGPPYLAFDIGLADLVVLYMFLIDVLKSAIPEELNLELGALAIHECDHLWNGVSECYEEGLP